MLIRQCHESETTAIHEIINDGARAYRGVIPSDCWHEPYMTMAYLESEIESGVAFWGYELDGSLLGVMGLQDVEEITLIRHAYVRTSSRRSGIGGKLLRHLCDRTDRPLLVGTWRAATWAVAFYEKHGFIKVSMDQIAPLLSRYWSIPARQIETSLVLGDHNWFEIQETER